MNADNTKMVVYKLEPGVIVQPAPYVTINLAATITGFTAKAIHRKIEEGVWRQGREYRKGPDGRIFISLKGYEAWVEQNPKSKLTSPVESARSKTLSGSSEAMPCPQCGSPLHTVQSINTRGKTIYRDRLCANGHFFVTQERATINDGRNKTKSKSTRLGMEYEQ